jgi:hypothetical protein
VKHFQTPANAQDVLVHGNLCYLAQGEGGLIIINVQDPSNPQIVSFLTESVRGYSRRIDIKDSIVYLAAGTFGFSVVNISDPQTPAIVVENLNMKPAKDAEIVDNYMFCAVSEQGIEIADISNPGLPDIRGNTKTNGYANGIAVNGARTLMFVACGEMGLNIYDISNFEDGYGTYPLVGWLDTPGYAEAVTLYEEKSVALLAAGSSGLLIIDYSDLNNLKFVGAYNSGGSAFDMVRDGDLVFLSAQRGGFHIVDISTLNSPQAIGRIYMKEAMGLDMNEDFIYVADPDDGLIIISRPK